MGALRGAMASLGFAATAAAAIKLADSFSQIQGRLRLVTSDTQNLISVQNQLLGVANSTRSSLTGTVELYGSLARSTQALGANQSELLQVTETINQAMTVSGASAQAAEAALIQLGQGMSSGVLRGEELNSILEQTPRLAKAIADGMGYTVGSLRALGADGKITGEQVFNALKSQRQAVEQEFSQMPATVGGALTTLGNNMITFAGQADKAMSAALGLSGTLSSNLAGAIKSFGDNLNTVLPMVTNLALIAAASFASKLAVSIIGTGVAGIQAAIGVGRFAMALTGATATATVATGVIGSLGLAVRGVMTLLGGPWAIALTAATVAIGYFYTESNKAEAATNDLKKASEEMRKKIDALNGKKPADEIAGVTKATTDSISVIASFNKELGALAQNYLAAADGAKKLALEQATSGLAEAMKTRQQVYRDTDRNNYGFIDTMMSGFDPGQTKEKAARAAADKLVSDAKELLSTTAAAAKSRFGGPALKTYTGGGTSGNSAKRTGETDAQRAKKQWDEKIDALKREADLSSLTTEQQRRQNFLLDAGLLAKQAGIKLDEQAIDQAFKKIEAAENLKKVQEEMRQQAEQLAQRYDPYSRAKEIERDISNIAKNDNLSSADKALLGEEAARQYREEMLRANAEIGRAWREEQYGVIQNFANLFGDKVGRAIGGIISSLEAIKTGTFNGTQVGGPLGAVAGMISMIGGGSRANYTGDKPFEQTFTGQMEDSFKKAVTIPQIKSLKDVGSSLKSGFKDFKSLFSRDNGGFIGALGKGFGKALGGMQTGAAVDGVFNALGIKSNGTTAKIGGAIGSAFGPIGGLVGGALGGLIGGLFTKTPQAATKVSTDEFGDIKVGTAVGDKKLRKEVEATAAGFASSLKQMQQMLGADIATSINLGSIGSRKGRVTFDPTGQNRTKGRGVQWYDSAADAQLAAMQNAIQQGLFTGIEAFSDRVLRSAPKDKLDSAVQLAAQYETVMDELRNFDDPITAPLQNLTKQFDKLRRQMQANAATVEELANVDRAYGIERDRIAKEQMKNLLTFRDALNGEGSGVTAMSRLQTALDRFSTLRTDVMAGRMVNQDDFLSAGSRVFDLARQVYGSATPEFQAIRQDLIAANDKLISTTEATQNNAAPVVDAVNAQTDAAARQHAEIMALLGNLPVGISQAIAGQIGSGGGSSSRMVNGELFQY